MNALSTVGQSLRFADTLPAYLRSAGIVRPVVYLLQRKQEQHDKSVGPAPRTSQTIWNWGSVVKLREKLADNERHMFAHAQTSGNTLEDVISEDEAYVISHSLMSVKLYLYSVVNMCSPFFRANGKTPESVNRQISELIAIVVGVRNRLENCGVLSDVADKGTSSFYKTVTILELISLDDESVPADEYLRQNLQVFRRIVNLAEDLRRGDNGAVSRFDDEDEDVLGSEGEGSDRSKSEDLFGLIPDSAKVLIEHLGQLDGTQVQCQDFFGTVVHALVCMAGCQK